MKRIGPWLGGGAIVLCAWVSPIRAFADAPKPRAPSAKTATKQERAQALHDEAQTLYEHGEYRLAISKLEAALELDPTGKELVYNLALIHERLAEVDVAEHYYRRYLEMENDPKVRERVQSILKRIDGAKREMEKKRAADSALAKPEPSPPPPPLPLQPLLPLAPFPQEPEGSRFGPAVLATGGVAVGSILLSGAFGIAAITQNPGGRASTSANVSISDIQSSAKSAHRDAVVADIAFVVGALAAGTSLYLYLSGAPPKAAASGFFAPASTDARNRLLQVAF